MTTPVAERVAAPRRPELLKTVLYDQRAVARVMSSLNLLANPVAHCSPMAEDEVERLRLSVKDWFRLMG